jgi:phosphoribosylformylglycinamidine cyclo-ligase
MKPTTYRDAGVDIHAGDRLVDLIGPMARSTWRTEALEGVGGFAGLISYPGDPDRLLAASTDGVGTKLLLALAAQRHDTVGIDLVAMCVNDLICVGAAPLFFLDYYASAKLSPEQAAEVISGIAAGCREAGCVLLGGETAELPGMYPERVYDLAGFSVGTLHRSEVPDPKSLQAGDVVLGLASSGFHSNGYSLVRRVFAAHLDEPGLLETLLRPTVIYVSAARALRRATSRLALAHITGGGLPGNLPRVLPEGLHARLVKGSWEVPPIFSRLAREGQVSEHEMLQTFNVGVGMCAVVPAGEAEAARAALTAQGVASWEIGRLETGEGEPEVRFDGAPLFGTE